MIPPSARRPVPVLVVLGGLMGCALFPERVPPEVPPDPDGELLRRGLQAADGSDFRGAREALEKLASRCESGHRGQEAVLILGAVELSPRNPDGSPSAAASLLARYLQEASAPARSLVLAETLYLAALELGAQPVEDPFAAAPGAPQVAPRFTACHREADPTPVRTLPSLPAPGSTRDALERALAERDSMAAQVDSLRRRNAALEGELERIRRLLLPDTASSGRSSGPLPR